MNNPASSTAVVQYIEEMNLHALGFPGFYPKNLFQTKLYNSGFQLTKTKRTVDNALCTLSGVVFL